MDKLHNKSIGLLLGFIVLAGIMIFFPKPRIIFVAMIMAVLLIIVQAVLILKDKK